MLKPMITLYTATRQELQFMLDDEVGQNGHKEG